MGGPNTRPPLGAQKPALYPERIVRENPRETRKPAGGPPVTRRSLRQEEKKKRQIYHKPGLTQGCFPCVVSRTRPFHLPSTARSMMVGRIFLVLTGACQFGHGVGGFTTNFIHSN